MNSPNVAQYFCQACLSAATRHNSISPALAFLSVSVLDTLVARHRLYNDDTARPREARDRRSGHLLHAKTSASGRWKQARKTVESHRETLARGSVPRLGLAREPTNRRRAGLHGSLCRSGEWPVGTCASHLPGQFHLFCRFEVCSISPGVCLSSRARSEAMTSPPKISPWQCGRDAYDRHATPSHLPPPAGVGDPSRCVLP